MPPAKNSSLVADLEKVLIDATEIEDLTRITLAGKVTLPELIGVLDSYARTGPTRLEIYDIEHLEDPLPCRP